MSQTTLKEDLLHEFREERMMISQQIDLLDPLATALRKPAAQRLISSGALIATEIACYLATLAGLAFMAFIHKVYPFTVLEQIYYNPAYRASLGSKNLLYLVLCIYGLVLVGVILLFIMGRVAREMRLKNAILNLAGKDIKTIVGQHLERKAALDTIEQRHMLTFSGISQPAARQNTVETPTAAFRISGLGSVNQVPNPGFD